MIGKPKRQTVRMLQLQEYKGDMQRELGEILSFWTRYCPDLVQGGFYGRIDQCNGIHPDAPRGVVLYSRILWTFSAAFNIQQDPGCLQQAERAYEYISKHFIDPQEGGVFWSVDKQGCVLEDRKQIYGLAFCVYGLSEFYQASKKQSALDEAIGLYRIIERHAYDKKQKGYYEAFTRDWKKIDDLRLSPKDVNEQKTMNTHLHVLEAYANLYLCWKNAGLRGQIENLLEVFAHRIIDDRTRHLNLFFDENWNLKSALVSYGHDIEAAWLLQRAAETVGHPGWTRTMKTLAVSIADAAAEGLDCDGGLKYETDQGLTDADKHWWPQAEAMVGFFNAYQLSGEEKYLHRSLRSWEFVRRYIKDRVFGEWHWGVHADHRLMEKHDKAGFWKCPYHNSRACMELIRRLEHQVSLQAGSYPGSATSNK